MQVIHNRDESILWNVEGFENRIRNLSIDLRKAEMHDRYPSDITEYNNTGV